MAFNAIIIQYILTQIKMGQQSTTQNISYKTDNGNWKQLSSINNHKTQEKVNQYSKRILYNTQKNQYVQEYELHFISESDFNEYSREYSTRKQHKIQPSQYESVVKNIYRSPYIYKIKQFINTSTLEICSTLHKGLLYVDKVDLRLKEIADIPFEDHVSLIFVTLQGFKLLYENVGYFDITEQMIFISYNGEVKVWINPNLSKHQPFLIHKSEEFQQLHGSQSYMIIKLLTIIQKNTDTSTNDCPTFKRHLINKGIYDRLSFYKALQELQIYCLEYKLTPMTFMKSIYDLYNDQPDKLEQSNVIQFSIFKGINKQLGYYKSENSSRDKYRKYSPQIKLKQMKLHQSQASKQSYYSQQSNKKQPNLKQQQQQISMLNPQNPKRQFHNNCKPNKIQRKTNYQIEQPTKPHQNIIHYDNTKIQVAEQRQQFSLEHPIKLDNLQMKPVIPTRLNSIRNSNFNRQQQQRGQNYKKQENSKNSMSRIENKNNLRTINTMNSVSTFSARQTQIFEYKSKQVSTKINFYSPNQVYSLDNQIMEDLQKMLGFNPNKF